MNDPVFPLDAAAGLIGVSDIADSPSESSSAQSVREQVAAHFVAYRLPIYRYLRYACGVEADAEELTQEVFLRLYHTLDRGSDIANTRTWLFAVARNLVVDRSRTRSSRISEVLDQVWRTLAETVPDPQPTSEERLIAESRYTEIRAALSCLTDRERECFHLRMEGLRYQEIAQVLGISLSTVGGAVDRAINRLRYQLGD